MDSALPRKLDFARAALLVVDVQPDFLPGGALGVQAGDAILDPVARLLRADRFAVQVATQDWHPPGHISFASSHQGKQPFDAIELYGHEQILWPDHCVQGSPGAELLHGMPWNKVQLIVRKATDSRVDSYSAFRHNWDERGLRSPTGLGGYLRDVGVSTVFVCGLARDFCVAWSAEDAAAQGFATYAIWDLCRPVDPASDPSVRADLDARSVHIVEFADVARAIELTDRDQPSSTRSSRA